MLNGVQVSLFIGPVVPVPVSRDVLDALQSVQVQVHGGDTPSGFELTFGLSTRSPLHTLFLLTGGSTIPIMRVVIAVIANGTTEVLMDGVMTHHEVRPGKDAGQTTFVIKGTDLTAVLDFIPLDGVPFPAMPNAVRVLAILAKYMALGAIPLVIPAVVVDVPIPTEQIPRQQGTDYAYVLQLARESGYVFYHEPGPEIGMSKFYWGPEIKVGAPQRALSVNWDAHSNCELSFTFDKDAKELPIVFVQNQATKIPFPIPILDISPLNPMLGVVPPIPPKLKMLDHTAKLTPVQALLQGLAYASQHSDCVTGTGTLDVTRYGAVLAARRLVGVRGAGEAFDGLYYVKSVTHNIKRGEYKQSFTLKRNGLLSTLPTVPA